MADGFLGRWSRRKLDVQQGKPVEAEPPEAVRAPASPQPAAPTAGSAHAGALPGQPQVAAGAAGAAGASAPAAPATPPPTMEDVAALTADSDFSRFSAPGVAPEVRNAAMKKLFSDPHFNVMDGLDVYIDDYSLPDPMPEEMLRSLASSEFLGLFREEKRTDEEEPGGRAAELAPARQYGAQSQAAEPAAPGPGVSADADLRPAAPDTPAPDADPDLRLQQDHAPGPQGPGQGDR